MNSSSQIIFPGNFEFILSANGFIAVIINGAIIFSMLLKMGIDSYTNLLIFLKIVFDQMYGMIIILDKTSKIWISESKKISENYFFNIYIIICIFSNNFFFFLVYHRYRLIKYPRDENEKICVKKIVQLFFVPVLKIIYSILDIFYLKSNNGSILFLIEFLLFFFPALVLSILFLLIILSMVMSKRNSKISTNNINIIKKLNKEIRIIIYFTIVLLDNLFYFIPDCTNMVYYFLTRNDLTIIYFIFEFMYSIHIVIDPIILLIFNRKLYENLKKTILCK